MSENQNREQPLILVIDEVAPVVRLLELELNLSGFATRPVLIDEDPIKTALEIEPDAVVLGAALPVPGIYETLMQLKARVAAPILFLHAGGNEEDGAVALDMGADDVLSRPFSPMDLSLRLRAMLKMGPAEDFQIMRGDLEIDVLHNVVRRGGVTAALSTSEWGLLLQLAKAEGVLSSGNLLTGVWGDSYAEESHFLRLWIDRLRTDLGDDPKNPAIILGDIESGFHLAN
jgi:two-component system, OmpR family, KDP operon response regulator KdpE